MTIRSIVSICFLFCALSAYAGDEHARQIKDMEKLAELIRAELPKNWKLEMTPFKSGDVAKKSWRAIHAPHIVVYSEKKVVANSKEAVSANFEADHFLLEYRLGASMTQAEWNAASAANERNDKTLKSYKKKLDACRNKHLKPSSHDPSNYKPTNDGQRQLLKEYHFVWDQVEIRNLPTYRFGNLSIWPRTHDGYRFDSQANHDEYSTVRIAISKLLNRYKNNVKN